MNEAELAEVKIILFDGICNLCDETLRFVARRDPGRIYKFAWAQSEKGRELLEWCGLPSKQLETVVYVEHGRPYFRSSAALKIARHLRFPWPLVYYAGMAVPLPIRDRVYDWISANRYKWFGTKAPCTLPDESLKSRFLWL